MRTMLRVSMDVQASSKAIQSGAMPKIIQGIMDRLKPEASYFFPFQGKRSLLMVFDMKDASEIPMIVESFFSQLNAEVELTPVMNADDLRKGLAAWMELQNMVEVSVN